MSKRKKFQGLSEWSSSFIIKLIKSKKIEFAPLYYDENGLLYGFIKNTSEKYFYIRDVYQNILGIMDNTGAIVVKYSYDAWGNHKVLNSSGNVNTADGFIGNINPFRYKGYYYDKESNMYYCQSRYYVPEWCRWLNADNASYLDPQNIHELNLFAYCKNNPVNEIDPSGCFAISTIILLACIGVGALVGGTYAGVTAYNDGARGWELVGWTALGTLAGGAVGGLVGYYAGPLVASLLSSGGGFVFAGGLGFAGVAVTGTMAGALVTAGAIGMTAVGALATSGVIMFAKGNGPRMGHNQYENKQFNSLCNKYKLTKEQRRILHDYISGQNYTYHEIEQIIIELFFRK
ncbi:MAG: RHS repeat-associated core domain-containing protein [Anaeroplasmataceae bacterium]|nr:RHS repeat-associated core domain-containing protein [Anaeroplasmataceae bacterium]